MRTCVIVFFSHGLITLTELTCIDISNLVERLSSSRGLSLMGVLGGTPAPLFPGRLPAIQNKFDSINLIEQILFFCCRSSVLPPACVQSSCFSGCPAAGSATPAPGSVCRPCYGLLWLSACYVRLRVPAPVCASVCASVRVLLWRSEGCKVSSCAVGLFRSPVLFIRPGGGGIIPRHHSPSGLPAFRADPFLSGRCV